MDVLSQPHFTDETAAREYLERLRWNGGRVCPHCGTVGRSYETKKVGRYRCGSPECRKDFTVTTKTVMESSHIALHKWLQGFYLMSSSKKGISAHQLHRSIRVTYKSAWFMAHRIREAMRAGGLAPLGGAGKVVEIDETLQGKLEGAPKYPPRGSHFAWRNTVLTLVERGGGARSFHVDGTTIGALLPVIRANVARESFVMTDELPSYRKLAADFAVHESVNHSKDEYVRGMITTNTVEGYFSIFKRGMKGVYQHCKERHLHRYLAEFDFRYSHRVALGYNDIERTVLAIKGAEGKRLTYRQPH
jgi:transposase-like protein